MITRAFEVFRADELGRLEEDTWHVRMTLETDTGNEREDLFELLGIVDVLGKDIFAQWITGRAMYEQSLTLLVRSRKPTQEMPAAESIFLRFARFELFPGPEDRLFGPLAETFGIEQSGLIVVAENAQIELSHNVDAFPRIGTVADDIPQAVDPIDTMRLDVLQNSV